MNKTLTFDTLESQDKALLLNILATIKDVSYGTVQITIHDSRIVQIDKTEKIRVRPDKYHGFEIMMNMASHRITPEYKFNSLRSIGSNTATGGPGEFSKAGSI